MPPSDSVIAIRRFNRFYTRFLGTLNEDLLHSHLSLAEARVLYEIANRTEPTASEIAAHLGMDISYLGRILQGFVAAHLLSRSTSPTDRRQTLLRLTAAGKKQFKLL